MDKLTLLMANDDRGRWSRGRRLEPSTFCMASSHFRTDLPRLLKNTSVYRASEGG
jgi:hypothetical protein